MKRSEIEVGTDVAVYISGAYIPHGRVGFGPRTDVRLTDAAQSDSNPSTAYSNEGRTFRATVVDVGADRYERGSRYHNVWKVSKSGVRVRLKKPIEVGWSGGEETTVFVAKAQQVLATWADVEARRFATMDADAEWRAKCDAFAPVLDRFMEKLREAGFEGVGVYGDGSGLHARDLSISLRHYRGRAYAFASVSSVTLDFSRFTTMLGVDVQNEESS